MSADVLIVGEAFVDFVPRQRGRVRDATGFDLCSGGAPANVAVGVARAGTSAAFAGVVGDDEFGWFIRGRLEASGVDCAGLRMTREAQTGLCFISLDATGERSFLHRGGDAAALLSVDDIDAQAAAAAKVVMFSSVALRTSAGAEAIGRLADAAGGLVCCDPGVCPQHWADPVVLRTRLLHALARCDVIKCSMVEAEFVTGQRDPERAAQAMVDHGAQLGVVTLGPHGAVWARAQDAGRVPAPPATVVDTTGAGDAFMAALLTGLAADPTPPRRQPIERLEAHLRRAAAAGAEAVTRRGAV